MTNEIYYEMADGFICRCIGELSETSPEREGKEVAL